MFGGVSKIADPSEFAETLASYQIIPYWSVNFFALALPWVELFCGVLLIVGFRTRAATAIISLLLITFATGIFINLIRDAPIDCGCFQQLGGQNQLVGYTSRSLMGTFRNSDIFL